MPYSMRCYSASQLHGMYYVKVTTFTGFDAKAMIYAGVNNTWPSLIHKSYMA